MVILKRLGWTGLLILIQPVKLVASVVLVAANIAYDVGREFVHDFRAIWTTR